MERQSGTPGVIADGALTLPADAPSGLAAWLVRVAPAALSLADAGPAERARAARFADPAHACRYLAARWRARELLARRLGLVPEAIVLGHVDGRPVIEARPEASISLAYSGPWLALALHSGPVGIDVEQIAPHRADALVAAMLLPGTAADAGFFDRWTALEATHKALDRGLDDPLHPEESGVRCWTLPAPAGVSVSLAVAP